MTYRIGTFDWDSAGAQAVQLEELLIEARDLGECHLDPLGLIPCPSRGMVYGLGVASGVLAVALIP